MKSQETLSKVIALYKYTKELVALKNTGVLDINKQLYTLFLKTYISAPPPLAHTTLSNSICV